MNRRESLAVVAGAAATLAGCSGFASSSSESSETPAADGREPEGPRSGSTGDPEMLRVRTATDRRPLWLADPDAEGGGRPTSSRRRREHDSTVVDTQSRADRLSLADAVDAERVDSFLSATDFETETLYLETIQVRACFELVLCKVSWQPDEVSTDYGRHGLPYDTRCRVDEHAFEARLIRLPERLDADEVNGYSSSVGGGGCGRDGPRAVAEADGGSGTSPATSTATDEAETATSTGGDR